VHPGKLEKVCPRHSVMKHCRRVVVRRQSRWSDADADADADVAAAAAYGAVLLSTCRSSDRPLTLVEEGRQLLMPSAAHF
jgi:hypothetical protein